MSTGKSAAQAGHAAIEAKDLSSQEMIDAWYLGKHYAKYIMEARDRDHLLDIQYYLEDRGFGTALIIDEGHTEIDPITPTALGVEIVDKDDPHTAATFESFNLYRDEPESVQSDDPLKPYRELIEEGRKFLKGL